MSSSPPLAEKEAAPAPAASSRTPAEAIIERIVGHTSDIRSLFLRPVNGQRLIFKPGQFLSLLLPVEGEILTRPYSIASNPEGGDLLEICFNLVPGGRGSHYLFSLGVGAKVRFTGPWGTFLLEQPPAAECVFVAEGTGIAPIRPMIRRALAYDGQFPLRLLYGADREQELLYRNELEGCRHQYPNFFFEVILRSPIETWPGLRGSLMEHVAQRYVIQDNDRTRHFYICGVGMPVLQLRDVLRSAGYQRRAVLYEKW